ncbi:MAG: histidine kinase [Dietzia sp.]|nr:histidine kinase [Dietzia sp.]
MRAPAGAVIVVVDTNHSSEVVRVSTGRDDDGPVTHTDHGTSRAELAAIVAALAVSIGALVIDPDVVAGRQLPGIAIAVAAAILLVVAGRFGRATVVAIGVLDVVTLAWTSSPIALRLLLAVALYRLVRRSDDRSAIWFGSLVAIVVAGIGAQVGSEPFWFEWATDAAVLLLPIAAADARRSNLQRRADATERQVAERLQAERLRIAYDLHDIVAHSLSAITVQSGKPEPICDGMNGGAVWARRLVMISAKAYSFQAVMKQNTAVAAMPVAASGRTILKKACMRV